MTQPLFEYAYLWDKGSGLRWAVSETDAISTIRSGKQPIWLHVDSQHCTDWPLVAAQVGLHPLAVEDTLSPECRVKIEEYENCLFVVVRDAYFVTETPEPYDFASTNLYIFIGGIL